MKLLSRRSSVVAGPNFGSESGGKAELQNIDFEELQARIEQMEGPPLSGEDADNESVSVTSGGRKFVSDIEKHQALIRVHNQPEEGPMGQESEALEKESLCSSNSQASSQRREAAFRNAKGEDMNIVVSN
jgi:hypothetical protein